MLGLDRLLGESPGLVAGKRLGLATNQAARDAAGRTCLSCFLEAGMRVERLFAPEHGYDLAHHEGARFGPGLHPEHGVPIVPFYGEGLRLTAASVEGLDALVFDLPNVGLRCHTYLANLVEALRFSHREQFPMIVLDRPNSLGGLTVEGPLVEAALMSDVAPVAMPFRHGLTFAEICAWLAREEALRPNVSFICMEGWRRSMWHDDTGLAWNAPSPNLATFAAMLAYPATVWLEGTNLSEGRGTPEPFTTFGAPWIDPHQFQEELSSLAGVRLEPAEFTPERSKHAGLRCRGLRLTVADRAVYRPLQAGFAIVAAARRLWPGSFKWVQNENTGTHFIDRLLGTARMRLAIEEGVPPDEVLDRMAAEADRFRQDRGGILIYG